MDNPTETATPENAAEPTVKQEAETPEVLKQQIVELQAQKEHWRGKYERDITSQQFNQPAPSEEPEEFYSDEGKVLKGEVKALSEKLRAIERKEARREAESEFPALADKKEEFDTFLEDEENKRLSVKKAAKLFLAESNLLSEPPQRVGLEKPTGGSSTPPEPKLSNEDVEHLMKTNWRQYEKLLREGKI